MTGSFKPGAFFPDVVNFFEQTLIFGTDKNSSDIAVIDEIKLCAKHKEKYAKVQPYKYHGESCKTSVDRKAVEIIYIYGYAHRQRKPCS